MAGTAEIIQRCQALFDFDPGLQKTIHLRAVFFLRIFI